MGLRDRRAGDGTLALAAPWLDGVRAAWGDGADWLLAQVPALLGQGDDWSSSTSWPIPRCTALAAGCRRVPGLRLCATGLVLDSLVPAVLEQRVTGREARRAWRTLLHRFGSPAPGPRPGRCACRRQPPTLRDVPTWDWHRMGVDLERQATIRAAATVAGRLEECGR